MDLPAGTQEQRDKACRIQIHVFLLPVPLLLSSEHAQDKVGSLAVWGQAEKMRQDLRPPGLLRVFLVRPGLGLSASQHSKLRGG